ncbi:hypothetical protein GCM10010462_25400 [Microbacterium dextranolyticum]|uniref:Uncharacterized protein n=2 Tax=Microbacterium dextranolyticum TaxID=36806 RepID=A0A9W6HPG2_9MICO|nr:hypothetical protein GCM10017591_26600 [Microbacterium dextranolyticum]
MRGEGLTDAIAAVNPSHVGRGASTLASMTLAIILLVVGIVLILLGVFVEAAKFLLWIGLVILIIAVIAWLMRAIKRNA